MRPIILSLALGLALSHGARAQPSPETLEALGAVVEERRAESQQPRPNQDIDRVFAELERQMEASDAAVRAAIALDAAGASPEAALRPIAALEGRTPLLPRLAAAIQTLSPRTFGYAGLVARHVAPSPEDGPAPSRSLALAAAAAWQAELARFPRDPVAVSEVGRLAGAYARLGEAAAARRAVDLDPRPDPLVRLGLLTEARAWDEAADLAVSTTVAQVTAALLTEAEAEYRLDRSRRTAAEARLASLMPQFDNKPDRARLAEEAEAQLSGARDALVAAARNWADAATADRIEARLAQASR